MNYEVLKFKRMGSGGDTATKETVSAFGIYCKEFPFAFNYKAKELYKNSWHDQNGDDEYVPSTIKIESYELTATFLAKGAVATVKSNIISFLNYLVQGELKVYDAYTGVGRQNVRFVSVSDDITFDKFYVKSNNTNVANSVVEFSITFKVNDPITNITL